MDSAAIKRELKALYARHYYEANKERMQEKTRVNQRNRRALKPRVPKQVKVKQEAQPIPEGHYDVKPSTFVCFS